MPEPLSDERLGEIRERYQQTKQKLSGERPTVLLASVGDLLGEVGRLRAENAQLREQRDNMLNQADDFQCQIASALGWDTGDETMPDMVKRIVREKSKLEGDRDTLRQRLAHHEPKRYGDADLAGEE